MIIVPRADIVRGTSFLRIAIALRRIYPRYHRSAPLALCFRVVTSFLALRAPPGMVSPRVPPAAERHKSRSAQSAQTRERLLSWSPRYHRSAPLAPRFLLVPYALRWNLLLGAPRPLPQSGTRAVRRRAPKRGEYCPGTLFTGSIHSAPLAPVSEW
jgi:hypothetical protein